MPPDPGKFIEFTASLRRNPLIEGLDPITRILEVATLFSGREQVGKKQKSGKNQGTPDQQELLKRQLNSLSEGLKAGGSSDLIADTENFRALLTVEEHFLNDPTMSDLVDGTFRVVGKVVRSVPENGSISLLRKTAFARTPDLLEKIVTAFENFESSVLDMPKMETEVQGPAIQVLPIAIFS